MNLGGAAMRAFARRRRQGNKMPLYLLYIGTRFFSIPFVNSYSKKCPCTLVMFPMSAGGGYAENRPRDVPGTGYTENYGFSWPFRAGSAR